ncbi:hypothetical protein OEZ71_10000 [Defluviimonas sp. WL0050]|uniref:Uncharacterized protein n=1 Tax=Albidovulum litorale TaxID=2984134 RepID=A0ABT2ZNA7_9RHOB|nr:hypothetical protein [Defluviimonas sp. WL0050]
MAVAGIPTVGHVPQAFAEWLNDLCDDPGCQKAPLEDSEPAASAVIDLLRRHVSWGEFQHVKRAVRKPIQELWD